MTALTFAEFYLSDGSEYINLLTPRNQSGFTIQDWQPLAPEPKDGGIFQGSPLSSGRRLVLRNYDNTIEGLTLAGRGNSPDGLIFESQRIRRLLEKAVNYWTTEWQSEPVYILARGVCETNVRYGLLYDYRAPGDGNPFASPFTGPDAAIFNEWELSLEHDAWTDLPPGESTAVQISGTGTFNGVTYGRAATTSNEVYVANKQNKANITHIFTYDDSTTTYSANLFGSALPYRLFPFPAGVAAGDILYIISDTSVTDSGPFSSLVWDIGITAASITFVYEYWTGLAWAAVVVQDNTNQFQNTGVNSMHWIQPSPWVANTINGVTGYIIRLRVTVAGGALVVPTQQNRQPYSITWANTAVQAAQVGGDLPALARHKIYTQSATTSVLPDLLNQRTLIGLRSLSRGSSFVSYINWADEQNPTGVTASAVTSGAVGMVTDSRAPTGRAVQYNIIGPGGPNPIAYINFTAAVASHFYGRYRAFVRLTVDTGTVDDITLQLFWGPALSVSAAAITPLVTLSFIDEWLLVDMGQIVIPNTNVLDVTDLYPVFYLILKIENVEDTNLKLYDLCLLPIDEWSGDFITSTKLSATAIEEGEYLDADSIFYPRAPLPVRAIQRNGTNDQVLSLWQPITSQPMILQANAAQSVHLLSSILDASSAKQQSFGGVSHLIQTERVQRYLSMRGSR